MRRIDLSIGSGGLSTNDNQLTTSRDTTSAIKLGSDGGLYVPPLSGDVVGSCDGWTIVERNGSITTNIENTYHAYTLKNGEYINNRSVQYVYCIGAYTINDHWILNDRRQKTFNMSATLKSAKDIVDEFNYGQEVIGVPVAPYYIMRGDLLMFKNQANAYYTIEDMYADLDPSESCYSKIFDKDHGKIQCWEDMNRYLVDDVNGTKILAMFSIDKVKYVIMTPRLRNRESLLLTYFKATCLWSKISGIMVGDVLEYEKHTNMPNTTEGAVVIDEPSETKEVITYPDTTDTNPREATAPANNSGSILKVNGTNSDKSRIDVLYDALAHKYYMIIDGWNESDVSSYDPSNTDKLTELTANELYLKALSNIISVYYNRNNKWGSEEITRYASSGPIQKISYADYYKFGDSETSDTYLLDTGLSVKSVDGGYDLTQGTNGSIFDDNGDSSLAKAYTDFLIAVQDREAKIIETIQTYSKLPPELYAFNGAAAVSESSGQVSTFIDALLHVIKLTDDAGYHTYSNSSVVIQDPDSGMNLHGRIDCTGMFKMALELMGYDTSNIQSHQLVSSCNSSTNPIKKGGSPSTDWEAIRYTSADQIQPGDILVRNGHGEVGICAANGTKYGFNFGCDDAIRRTQAYAKGLLDGTYSDLLSSAVEHAACLGSQGYAYIIRYTCQTTMTNDSITTFLQEGGINASALGSSQQLIIVKSNGSKAAIYMFEKSGTSWSQKYSTTGYVASNGVGTAKEGISVTPKGLYGLGFAFGGPALSGMSIEYRQLTSNCYWVDDPDSDYYNQWRESTSGWSSAEHLYNYKDGAYKYAVVIEYNMSPVVKDAGSAIFLHCSTGNPTAGCVSMPPDMMLTVLKWLNSSKQPKILIY